MEYSTPIRQKLKSFIFQCQSYTAVCPQPHGVSLWGHIFPCQGKKNDIFIHVCMGIFLLRVSDAVWKLSHQLSEQYVFNMNLCMDVLRLANTVRACVGTQFLLRHHCRTVHRVSCKVPAEYTGLATQNWDTVTCSMSPTHANYLPESSPLQLKM